MMAPAAPATPDVPATPSPCRRRSWARRHKFATSVLALLTLTVLLRLAWGWYCARELADEWEKIRAQGHPTTLAEITPTPLPDVENAWLVYAEAIAALDPTSESPSNSAIEYPS